MLYNVSIGNQAQNNSSYDLLRFKYVLGTFEEEFYKDHLLAQLLEANYFPNFTGEKKKSLEMLGNVLIKSELKTDRPGSKTKPKHKHTHVRMNIFVGCPGNRLRHIKKA